MQLYLHRRQYGLYVQIIFAVAFFFSFLFLFLVLGVYQWNLCNSKAVYKVSTCDLNDRMFRDLCTVCVWRMEMLSTASHANAWKWLYNKRRVWVECFTKKMYKKQWILVAFLCNSVHHFQPNLKLQSSKYFSYSSRANNKSPTLTNMPRKNSHTWITSAVLLLIDTKQP